MMKQSGEHRRGRRGNRAPIILLWLIAIIGLMAIVHLVFQYLNLSVYNELNGRVFEISNRVDFDDEASIPTWFSQLLFLSISASAFLAAMMQKVVNARRLWMLIGIGGFLFSIDEVAALHELLLQILHLIVVGEVPPTVASNAWLILLPFVLVGAGLLLWQMIKYTPRRVVGLFMLGGFLFLFGAIFIDIVTNVGAQNTFYNKGILVAIEESLELVGTSIVLYAILDYLEQGYGDRLRKALAQLRS